MSPSPSTAWEIFLAPPPEGMQVADLAAVLLVADAAGSVRLVEPVADVTPESLRRALERAADAPAPAPSGWPEQARIHAPAGEGALREVLEAAGVRVVEDEELPQVATALSAMGELLMQTSPEAFLGVGERQRELCEAIARIAERRPWEVFDDETRLSMSFEPPLPAPFERPVAGVLGGAGQLFGLVLYEDRQAAEELLEAAIPWDFEGGEAPSEEAVEAFEGALRGIQVLLEPEDEVPASLLDAWRAEGWPLPAGFVPRILRYQGGAARPLFSPEEHEATLAMLEALAAFCEARLDDEGLIDDEPFEHEVAGGRRAIVRVEGGRESNLPWLDRDTDLVKKDFELWLARPEAGARELLRAVAPDVEGVGAVLVLKTTKDEARRVAREASSAKLAFFPCTDIDDEPGVSAWIVEGEGEAASARLLGLVRTVASLELLPALRPPEPGEARRLAFVVAGGGARRRQIKAGDVVGVHILDVVPPPKAVLDQLQWDDDEDDEARELALVEIGRGYGAFGWPPPPEPSRPRTPRAAAGRNDPCPCGSGKKYKKCCLGKILGETPAQRAFALHALDRQLVRRLLDFFDLAEPRALDRAARSLAPGFGLKPVDVVMTGPWVAYVGAPDEAPLARRFLEQNEELGAEERAWLESQLAAPLSLWRVVDVTPGESVRLEDVLTKEQRLVFDRSGSRSIPREGVILARVVDHGGLSVLSGAHPLPLDRRDAAVVEDFVRRVVDEERRVTLDDFRHGAARPALLKIWDEVASARLAQLRAPKGQSDDGEAYL